MSETELMRAICDAINATRLAFVWRNQSGKVRVRGGFMRLAPAGSPDLVGYVLRGPMAGRFIGIEVKVPGHKTDVARAESQLHVRQHIEAHGGLAGQVETVADALALVRGVIARGVA